MKRPYMTTTSLLRLMVRSTRPRLALLMTAPSRAHMVPVRPLVLSKKQMIQKSVVMCRTPTLTRVMVQVVVRTNRTRKRRRKGPKTAGLLSTPPYSARKTRINKRKRMIRSLTTIGTRTIKLSKDGKPGGRTCNSTTIKHLLSTAVNKKKSTAARSKKRRGEGRSTSRLSSKSAESTKSV